LTYYIIWYTFCIYNQSETNPNLAFRMVLKTSQIQVQKQILAPIMRQSIEVLLLPIAELNSAIETQLQENPLLEIDEAKTKSDDLDKKKLDEIIDNNLRGLKEGASHPIYDTHNNTDDEPDDNPLAKAAPLEDYLLQQLHLELNDSLEIQIGEMIIGNLDENGYFKASCDEIAEKIGLENAQPVEMVLHMIQNFEPLGIAARNLKECLLIQAHFRFNGQSETIKKIINHHLDELGKKKYVEIARQLNVTPEKIKEYSKAIAQLEPIPARKYRPLISNLYVRPDITISKNEEDEYTVMINNEYIPRLRISPVYQRMLEDPKRSLEEKEYIREKIKNALFFMKSITQRNQTIKDIAQFIIRKQSDFFEGDVLDLRPLTLKEVASAIDRNESTISRAINNKYMQTPQGLLPLKFFFSQAVSDVSFEGRGSVSNRSLKEQIKWLIEDENKDKPLSDQDIQNRFKEQGVQLARRTVSKYRQAMNILPSHLRKN